MIKKECEFVCGLNRCFRLLNSEIGNDLYRGDENEHH